MRTHRGLEPLRTFPSARTDRGRTRTSGEISTGQRVHNASRPFARDAGAARSEGRRRSPRRRVRGRVHHPPFRGGGEREDEHLPPARTERRAGRGEGDLYRYGGRVDGAAPADGRGGVRWRRGGQTVLRGVLG